MAVITIDEKRALKLFTDWHVDEVTTRAEARNYARRLWRRLVNEARVDPEQKPLTQGSK